MTLNREEFIKDIERTEAKIEKHIEIQSLDKAIKEKKDIMTQMHDEATTIYREWLILTNRRNFLTGKIVEER